jgi:ornithine cyclodeaminase/alanine dehydrogenase-like protein (mu-crystallin family)
MSIRLLSEKDVRCLVPTLSEVVALVEQAYRLDGEGKAEVPTKIGVHPERASLLHAMPAWVSEARALGMKWVSYFPGNAGRGLPDLAGIIVLNDPEHGQPCCIMEAMLVTFLRTAACAAVAAKHLAPRAPRTLGLIGCGGLGRWSLRVMTAVFPSIEQVYVSSRTRRSREEFCASMAADADWKITPVDDPLLAVRGLDIVVTSIPPCIPSCIPPGADSRPVAAAAFTAGTLLIPLDLMHSWQDDVLACADRIAADNPGHFSAQVQARRAAAFPSLKPPVPIQDLVIGKLPRAAASDRTVIAVCGRQHRYRGGLGDLPSRVRAECRAAIRHAGVKGRKWDAPQASRPSHFHSPGTRKTPIGAESQT